MDILKKLKELDLELPTPTTPGGNYVSFNIRKDIAYIAIQFPIWNNKAVYQGKLGEELSTDDGYKALGICALNVLSQITAHSSIDQFIGINHLDIYFQATAEWDEAPQLADGASDLFVRVLADRGQHSRAIFGVERLPKNFCVGLTATCTIASHQRGGGILPFSC
ncbi:RidA family protein [Sphingobacterium gobiense]|uniref:RidA family protein n=1 Tax=Sphingobacterium gobiense TaxID=1382456 RepID=A0A2S9JNB4_9SPHI|nr:RidA family protein [Sphingobacterium gobiense]PRD54655.1 RidA family protein [Sphingobacterium gobiense]